MNAPDSYCTRLGTLRDLARPGGLTVEVLLRDVAGATRTMEPRPVYVEPAPKLTTRDTAAVPHPARVPFGSPCLDPASARRI